MPDPNAVSTIEYLDGLIAEHQRAILSGDADPDSYRVDCKVLNKLERLRHHILRNFIKQED